ncbi:hypothetical protein WICPIJ_005564 [Wickerhamomyces pijperi]|uniref:Peptide hydrolase n=1 Tax=Wickerhamomyces pijperi TaxID=599730 RepID=A0A9P8TLV7_WICPI|nr:hypothetical protein WICPIJ_005564 [Wickerhamomyces pijperi]
MSDTESQPLIAGSSQLDNQTNNKGNNILTTEANTTTTTTVPNASTNNTNTTSNEPSFVVKSVRAVFGFRKTSLTLLVVLTYAIILIFLPILKDYNFKLPTDSQGQLPSSLNSAWYDLQSISQKPHPYISHANDEVHDYILERVNSLSQSKKYITVDDDVESKLAIFDVLKSTWNASSQASPLHYLESGNILVKIEGTDPTLDGVLLSAHYDSVPTAFGTTDDGTGIAAMLGVLESLSQGNASQPLRTIVFNFNNNEEFGLFGAVAFLRHPWSQLVKYFVNLEGTGIGDRAILFRTTDYDITTFYSEVENPFASSIYQEGFASGLIHSETDYRIYANAGLRGLDIAFYKPRSLYHTPKDNIQFTSKNALWHMLSQALDLVTALSNAKTIGEDADTPAVYFDFLGLYFVNVRLSDLTIINIVLLCVIPIFLIIFGLIVSKRGNWTIGVAWIRLPISLAVSLIAAKFALQTVTFFNPFIASGDFTDPLLLTSSTFLFVNYAILTVWNTISPICDFKLLITLEVYATLWIGLAVLTYFERRDNIMTGKYLFTLLYCLYSVVSLLGLFSFAVSSPKTEKISVHRPSNNSDGSIPNDHPREGSYSDDIEAQADENVPLLSEAPHQELSESDDESSGVAPTHKHTHKSVNYDWILQFLILIPLSFILSYTSLDLILQGLSQTMQESSASQAFVYKLILGAGLLLTVPVLSFAYKLNYLFAVLLIISIVSSGFLSVSKPAFTQDSPIKFRFAQTINLDHGSQEPVVGVYGREGFLGEILSDLPSVKSSGQEVVCEFVADGSELCSYVGLAPNLIDTNTTNSSNDSQYDFNELLNFEVIKSNGKKTDSPYTPLSAELRINAKQNRYCHLTFNTSSFASYKYGKSPIKLFTYYHDDLNSTSNGLTEISTFPAGGSKDPDGNDVFKWLPGIDDIHLHKLNWDQDSYHIGLQWVPRWLEEGEDPQPIGSASNKLTVSVSCYYGEWDDVSIIDGVAKRKIPAYDEILEYSPLWTSWSNRFEGLVVVQKSITL